MDPVTAVANALGQLFGAVGTPIAIGQQRKLAGEQFFYSELAAQDAAREAARQRNFYMILAAVGLLAVTLIVVMKRK